VTSFAADWAMWSVAILLVLYLIGLNSREDTSSPPRYARRVQPRRLVKGPVARELPATESRPGSVKGGSQAIAMRRREAQGHSIRSR
jgi:hypothetical protein